MDSLKTFALLSAILQIRIYPTISFLCHLKLVTVPMDFKNLIILLLNIPYSMRRFKCDLFKMVSDTKDVPEMIEIEALQTLVWLK
jgi:hypothetical protein